ncbi:MAG TPA: prolyl oligopeptidase family serine peptidase [Stenotrophobium sp.]|jgi:dienelactone hydrolase|nr:prolyl oligopeptidase family serine peptidase [Stenotrophobium sp.]
MRGLLALSLVVLLTACGSSGSLSLPAASGAPAAGGSSAAGDTPTPALLSNPLVAATPQVIVLPAAPNDAPIPLDGNPNHWRAEPSHLAGTAHYDQGEWIYEDYPYTAYGAALPGVPLVYGLLDSLGNLYNPLQRVPGGIAFVIPQAGAGPFVEEADLYELRFAVRDADLYVLARTTTMRDPVRTALLLLFDTGKSGAAFTVPFGSGLTTSQADTAVLVTANGVRIIDLASGKTHDAAAAADASDYVNTLEAKLPLALVATPDGAHLRFVAATSLVSGGGYEFDAGGSEGPLAKVVPRFGVPVQSTYDRMQALALAAHDIDPFITEVSLDRLRAGDSERLSPGIGYNVRTFVAPEAISSEGGVTGTLREYGLYVPRGFTGAPTPATLILRGSSMTAHGLAAITPGLFQNLGDDNGAILISPGGRSPFDLFQGAVYHDVLQAIDDAQSVLPIDPDRLTVAGYSMGGYATYMFAATQPDRFAGAFVIEGLVGGNQPATTTLKVPDIIPSLSNLLYEPIEIYQGDIDADVPITNALAAVQRLQALGLRYRLNLLPGNTHFSPGLQNDYSVGARYLKGLRRERSPSHVIYSRSMPFERAVDTASNTDQATAGKPVGLRFADAWFVHDLEASNPVNGTATVDVRTFARPQETITPVASVGVDTGPLDGQPLSPYAAQSWQFAPVSGTVRNAFDAQLSGVAHVRFDLADMALDPAQPLTATIHTDKSTTLTFTVAQSGCHSIDMTLAPGDHVIDLQPCSQ